MVARLLQSAQVSLPGSGSFPQVKHVSASRCSLRRRSCCCRFSSKHFEQYSLPCSGMALHLHNPLALRSFRRDLSSKLVLIRHLLHNHLFVPLGSWHRKQIFSWMHFALRRAYSPLRSRFGMAIVTNQTVEMVTFLQHV